MEWKRLMGVVWRRNFAVCGWGFIVVLAGGVKPSLSSIINHKRQAKPSHRRFERRANALVEPQSGERSGERETRGREGEDAGGGGWVEKAGELEEVSGMREEGWRGRGQTCCVWPFSEQGNLAGITTALRGLLPPLLTDLSTLHSFHLYRSQPHRSHHLNTHYATPVFENRSRIAIPDVTSERRESSRGGEMRDLRREDATVGRCSCCKLAKDEDEISVEWVLLREMDTQELTAG
jgi:hypothetical protein